MSGAGKTQIIHQVLQALQARRTKGRDSRAVVLDLKGDFTQHYYREGDVIFNPLDARTLAWSPFAEIRANSALMRSDLDALGAALLPPNPRAGTNRFFDDMARVVLIEIMEALFRRSPRVTNAALQRALFVAEYAELYTMMESLPHAQTRRLFASGSREGRTTDSVWATLMAGVKMLRLLDPAAGRRTGFSFRRWGRSGPAGQWIFLTRRLEDAALLGQIHATVISLLSVGQMSVPDAEARPVHYVLDELAQAGTVAGLEQLLTFGRSKRAGAVIGIQALPQLVQRYGRESAATLLGQAGALVVLRQGEHESARIFADLLGKKRDTRRLESTGAHGTTKIEQRYEEHHWTPTNLLHLRALSRSEPGQGLVRIRTASGRHPPPQPIRVVHQGRRIPPAQTPAFVQGGKKITWAKRRQHRVRDEPESRAGRQEKRGGAGLEANDELSRLGL